MKKEIKVESGNISIVFMAKTLGIYKEKKLLTEIEMEDAKDLMNCFFDTINRVNQQEQLKNIVKGKRKPKTSKHK